MPPQLLEFGGAEVPAQEERAELELSNAQAAWVEEVARAAQPIFVRAKTRLREAHMAEQDVKTLLFTPSAEESFGTSILTAARAHRCSTVVGREAFSWLKEFFQAHVADKLIPQAGDLTLWIVQ
jgi:K+-sensing histidine kinase KdpD